MATDDGAMLREGTWRMWSERVPERLRWLTRERFVRFLLVGMLNTAFGYGLFAILILLGVPYALASLLSTIGGIVFNFKSYGTLVFGSHDNRLIARFFAVYAVCYGLNLVPLWWAERAGISLLLVGAIMALPMAALSFVLNRRFVFESGAKVAR